MKGERRRLLCGGSGLAPAAEASAAAPCVWVMTSTNGALAPTFTAHSPAHPPIPPYPVIYGNMIIAIKRRERKGGGGGGC